MKTLTLILTDDTGEVWSLAGQVDIMLDGRALVLIEEAAGAVACQLLGQSVELRGEIVAALDAAEQ